MTGQDALLSKQIVAALRSVLGDGSQSLHEPAFRGNEMQYLHRCIETSFVSSVGDFVPRFEGHLTEYTSAKYAIAVVNGTAALHIALLLAGVAANDEVIVPALTFAATPNAVTYCGASPHFAECNDRDLGIDIQKLRQYLNAITEKRGGLSINKNTGKVIRAVVPVHVFGHPVELDNLMALAHDFGLVIVEDASESLGSFYRGRHTGTFGLIGTLSFNGNKTITTGGGGAILTNDSVIADRAKHITTTARLDHRWKCSHDDIGYNYRMPNLNAAVGCAQMECLPQMLANKRELFAKYCTAFQDIDGVTLINEPAHSCSNYWLNTLLLDCSQHDKLETILAMTNDAGIMTRPSWTLMHCLPHFQHCQRMKLSVAESLHTRLINIPSSAYIAH